MSEAAARNDQQLRAELAAAMEGVYTLNQLQKAIKQEQICPDSLERVTRCLWTPLREALAHTVGLEGHAKKPLSQVAEVLGIPKAKLSQYVVPRALLVVRACLNSCNLTYNPFITASPPRNASLTTFIHEAVLLCCRDHRPLSVATNLEDTLQNQFCPRQRLGRPVPDWSRTRAVILDNRSLDDLCSRTPKGLCLTANQAKLASETLAVFRRYFGDCKPSAQTKARSATTT